MNYRINYNVVLYSETLYDKEIIVKNKSNELIANLKITLKGSMEIHSDSLL